MNGFRFGIDSNGNYGYKKVGADTVIPFKTAAGTYSYPSGSTGGTTDIESYKYVNASNVYSKGKEDGRTWTLLWENSKPTSAFAAQTVSLDLSKYKYVIIQFRKYTNVATVTYCIIEKGSNAILCHYGDSTTGSAGYAKWRKATVNDTGVVFTTGYSSTGGSITDTKAAIPVNIYGL